MDVGAETEDVSRRCHLAGTEVVPGTAGAERLSAGPQQSLARALSLGSSEPPRPCQSRARSCGKHRAVGVCPRPASLMSAVDVQRHRGRCGASSVKTHHCSWLVQVLASGVEPPPRDLRITIRRPHLFHQSSCSTSFSCNSSFSFSPVRLSHKSTMPSRFTVAVILSSGLSSTVVA